MQAEAKLEKESLEERIRIGESKTTVLRRERNALLAALRDIQRRGRTDPNPLPPSMGLEISRNEGRGGEKLRFDRSDANGASTTNVAQSGSKFCSRTSNCTISERIVKPRPFDRVVAMDGAAGMDAVSKSISCGGISRDGREGVEEEKSRETGNGDAGGGGKGAELSARLEALALQTRQLLARDSDSDTSCSSDDDDLDSGWQLIDWSVGLLDDRLIDWVPLFGPNHFRMDWTARTYFCCYIFPSHCVTENPMRPQVTTRKSYQYLFGYFILP